MFLTLFAIFLAAVIIVPLVSADDGNITPITTPFITIDPIGNHTIDEVFFINGTTSLPSDSGPLILEIETTHINPGGAGSSFHSNVSIQPGENGINTWSCNVTTSLWETFGIGPRQIPVPDAKPDEYRAFIYGPLETFTPGQLFFIFPSGSSVSPGQTIPVASSAYYENRTIEPSPTTQSSPLPAALPIIVVTAMVILSSIHREW